MGENEEVIRIIRKAIKDLETWAPRPRDILEYLAILEEELIKRSRSEITAEELEEIARRAKERYVKKLLYREEEDARAA